MRCPISNYYVLVRAVGGGQLLHIICYSDHFLARDLGEFSRLDSHWASSIHRLGQFEDGRATPGWESTAVAVRS